MSRAPPDQLQEVMVPRPLGPLDGSEISALSPPFSRSLARQIHPIIEEPCHLDDVADAVQEKVSSSSATTGDVIDPRVRVDVRPPLPRSWRGGECAHGMLDQLAVLCVLGVTELVSSAVEHFDDLYFRARKDDDD